MYNWPEYRYAAERVAHHPRRLNRSGKLSAKTIFQNGYDLGAAERRRVHGRVGPQLRLQRFAPNELILIVILMCCLHVLVGVCV
jgi:hypothetical protein